MGVDEPHSRLLGVVSATPILFYGGSLANPRLAMGVAQQPPWQKWGWPATPSAKNGGGWPPPLANFYFYFFIFSFFFLHIFNISLIFKLF
jgi:hypothetical protein